MLRLEQKFYFLQVREQILLVGFLLTLLVIWGLSLQKSWKEQNLAYQSVNEKLSYQSFVLAEEPNILKQLEDLRSQFDPKQTINLSKLSERMESLAKQVKISPDILRPVTRAGEIFSINTQTVRLNAKPIDQIIAFTELLQAESPYVRINELKISPKKNNPTLLDVSYIVSSIELNTTF